jgi:hypothetical protein
MVARTNEKTRQNIKRRHGFEFETLRRIKAPWGTRWAQGPLTSGEAAHDHIGRPVKPGIGIGGVSKSKRPEVYSDPPLTENIERTSRVLSDLPSSTCSSALIRPSFGICIVQTELLPHDTSVLKVSWPDDGGRALTLRQGG